jgi:hypothetical protein
MERGFKTRCENLSLQIRSDLGLNMAAALPPESLAEHLGVLLWKPRDILDLSREALTQLGKDRDSWSAVSVSLGGIDAVIYNPLHLKGRQSSDIMHELSHILLDHKPIEMFLFSKDMEIVLRDYDLNIEEEATWLSGCLLLPRDVLLHIRRNGMDDQTACQTYFVSASLLHYRMNITGIDRQIPALRKHGK